MLIVALRNRVMCDFGLASKIQSISDIVSPLIMSDNTLGV